GDKDNVSHETHDQGTLIALDLAYRLFADANSLRVLGDRRPFEERLKQRRGRKSQASHVIRHPSTYNVGNQEKMTESTRYTWRSHV
ncbi:hypothetical protein PIB30_107109, partial [Stylosanthes scabra]|nr:hypothetical protein [Stylosanthes scabra]